MQDSCEIWVLLLPYLPFLCLLLRASPAEHEALSFYPQPVVLKLFSDYYLEGFDLSFQPCTNTCLLVSMARLAALLFVVPEVAFALRRGKTIPKDNADADEVETWDRSKNIEE